MLHGHDHVLRPGHQVHRAAHARHHLPGHHPVGQIAFLVHLQAAEHGHIHMPAADDAERQGAVEEGRAGDHAARLAAGVDQVGQRRAAQRPQAEEAVLRLQRDMHIRRAIISHQGGQTNPQVDDIAVVEFLRHAARNTLFSIHD